MTGNQIGCLVCSEVQNSNIVERLFNQCVSKDELFKCVKIHALKIMIRALNSRSLNVVDGVRLIANGRQLKTIQFDINLNNRKLQALESKELDDLLSDTSFSMRIQKKAGRKNKEGGNGALYWALAIKGSFLAIAYQGIAVMAGLALIMGKMALLLSAILGLKKLVSNGHETTTFEIIKQPKYTEQHTHATSYEDEGHHHRSYDNNDLYPTKSVYRDHI
ncbi:hypothetical protein NQ314_009662 [Rhamnusium bicolor]|uniref:Uncharacterized protein n=1 Tax=Rhamnusium bicolor TaxID=1586634 RepID=A0AAV8XZL0_9CUCU|nr:hypothetical protein NQ314_009662 [Rhamnusium bicolor]